MVSALCVLPLLICTPRPAEAQSNLAGLQMPRPFLQSLQLRAKLSEAPKSAGFDAADFHAEFSSGLTSELRTNKKLFFLDDQ
jgi:hypothetical protein